MPIKVTMDVSGESCKLLAREEVVLGRIDENIVPGSEFNTMFFPSQAKVPVVMVLDKKG